MRVAGCEVFLVVVFLAVAIIPAAYAQDIPGLKIKAEQGDVQAQAALGNAYHTGEGVTKDDAEAVRWWRKRLRNRAVAPHQIDTLELLTTLAPEFLDSAAAARWYRGAAEKGNGGAQSDLALVSPGSRCFQKTTPKPCAGGRKPLGKVLLTAQGNLGTAYGLGTGVPKDESPKVCAGTLRLPKTATQPAIDLGMFYVQGTGVPEDEAEGVNGCASPPNRAMRAVSFG